MTFRTACCVAAAVIAPAAVAKAPVLPMGGLPVNYDYVELTDMALAAHLVLAADIVDATALKPDAAPDVPAGKTRYFVQATVTALIAGQGSPPAALRYLVDLPSDLHKPKLKDVPVILLANASARPGEIVLVGPRAQVPRTPENEARIRAILTESIARDAPPAITGISRAFHVAGTLPGEGETQIFLRTADHRPISLSILRRPGEDPRWAVALSELVDASATPPKPNSFLWYRLACGLPHSLPPESLEGAAAEDVAQAKTDYQLVLEGLGPCRHGA